MDMKYSAAKATKRTPLMRGNLAVPYLMWGNVPVRRRSDPMRSPIHPAIVGFGATALIGAFATDVAYAGSALFEWENFSVWLITAGLVLAAAAAAALIFDALMHRIEAIDWARFCGFIAATLLSILNALVHNRDAYTAVVPQGVILSGIVTAILLALGWFHGWSVGQAPSSSSLTERARL